VSLLSLSSLLMRNYVITMMMHTNEKFEIIGNLGCWCIQDENSNYGLVLELEVDGLVSRNFHAPISIQCLSSLFLNALVDGASTTCCGNSFQQLIIILISIWRQLIFASPPKFCGWYNWASESPHKIRVFLLFPMAYQEWAAPRNRHNLWCSQCIDVSLKII